jgi:hypothetical protein
LDLEFVWDLVLVIWNINVLGVPLRGHSVMDAGRGLKTRGYIRINPSGLRSFCRPSVHFPFVPLHRQPKFENRKSTIRKSPLGDLGVIGIFAAKHRSTC